MKIQYFLWVVGCIGAALKSDSAPNDSIEILETRSVIEKRWIRRRMEDEIKEATSILTKHTQLTIKGSRRRVRDRISKIPGKKFKDCIGIAIISVVRIAFDGPDGNGGTGILLRRLKNGEWSAPSTFSTIKFKI